MLLMEMFAGYVLVEDIVEKREEMGRWLYLYPRRPLNESLSEQ